MTVRRGEIYYIERSPLTPETGVEQQAGRPGIIVSNDIGNEHSEFAEVVYLTTKTKKPLPTHVTIKTSASSIALCEQVHSVSKTRIGGVIRDCTEEEMKKIDKALMISLGLDSETKATADTAYTKPFTIPIPAEDAVNLLRLETERNIYKNMYESLLDKVTG